MAYPFSRTKPYLLKEGDVFLGVNQEGYEVGIRVERHLLTFGGSGMGKGVGLIVPNLRQWPHNLIAIDPKDGENIGLTWEHREALGQTVVAVDPYQRADIPARLLGAFNPLEEIAADDPMVRKDIEAIANGLIVSYNDDHMEWTDTARAMLAGLIAYVKASAPPEAQTLMEVRRLLLQPNQEEIPDENAEGGSRPAGLYITAQLMLDVPEFGNLAPAAGALLMNALEAEKDVTTGALSQVRRATKWLDDPAMQAVLGHSTFRLSDLKRGKLSLYLVLPPDAVEDSPAFLRLFVRCALTAMERGKDGAQCLFLLDEFFSLGTIEKIEKAEGLMRHYGVRLWPFLQNFGQLLKLYGKHGASTFLTNSDAVMFLGNTGDEEGLKYISDRAGLIQPDEIQDQAPIPEPYIPTPQPVPLPFVPTPQPKPVAYVPTAQPEANAFQPPTAPQKSAWYSETHQIKGFFSSESEEQSRARLAVRQENEMREFQTRSATLEAQHRANEEGKMRDWQRRNSAAEAEHRANEEAKMRQWQKDNTAAELEHRANEESRLRKWHTDNAAAQEKHAAHQRAVQLAYEHRMRSVGTPRLPVSLLEKMLGKGHGETVARSMIVFAFAGDMLRLKLRPYFQPATTWRKPWPSDMPYLPIARTPVQRLTYKQTIAAIGVYAEYAEYYKNLYNSSDPEKIEKYADLREESIRCTVIKSILKSIVEKKELKEGDYVEITLIGHGDAKFKKVFSSGEVENRMYCFHSYWDRFANMLPERRQLFEVEQW